jgi:predicted dehydrogenase
MKGKVKICAIGCGGMAGTFHYPSLAEMKDVELAALCEISKERLKIGMDKFGFKKGYRDYKEMLEKEKPDAVYVILHTLLSYPVLEYCYRQKYDVFSEKPPALTIFQTRVLAEIVKKNKNITQIGYQRKYIPIVRKMRQMVEKKGPIDQFTVTFCKNSAQPPVGYGQGTDILTSDASHMLDCMLWLAGSDPVNVSSIVRKSYADNNVKYNALVLFPKGVSGFFSANWNSGRRFLDVEIHGNGCAARTDVENAGTYYDGGHPNGITVTAQQAAASDKPHRVLGFFDQSRDFIDGVKTRKKPMGCLENALKTMELVAKIYAGAVFEKESGR